MPFVILLFMNKIDRALYEFREMDELAEQDSPVHRFPVLPKVLLTILYILIVLSFHKYDLSSLSVMILFPVFFYQLSGIPLRKCFYKLRFVLPLVMAVGILNPFFDHTVIMKIGPLSVTGGWISMLTLMLKGILALTASFLLVATSGIARICAALRRMHVPSVLVTLLLLTYRYITVLSEEVSVMSNAYHLRAPRQKGIEYSAWGSFLGQLLLRSMDRAEEIYQAMLLRGFHGHFHYVDEKPASPKDWLTGLLIGALIVFCRYYNVASFLGSLFVR